MDISQSDQRVMHVSNQAVCRTLNTLARSRTLDKHQRHRVARAILGLRATEDIVSLIIRSDPSVEELDPGIGSLPHLLVNVPT